MHMTIRPIDRWDRTETNPRLGSPFKATYESTLELLDMELRQLDAKNVAMLVDVTERDCRIDGRLRADARLRSPRVMIVFDSEYGPLKYACDRFIDWHDNVRAIALGLQALRRVERYGIATRGEQYTGWKQLGSGIAMGARMTREEAVEVIIDLTMDEGRVMFDYGDLDRNGRPGAFLDDAYRKAARTAHPDHGGTGATFAALSEAFEVLRGN